jgi:hypothetical protein
MSDIAQHVYDRGTNVYGDVWQWFNGLDREEWVVVLGAVCVMGFFCMLGYGSRSKY